MVSVLTFARRGNKRNQFRPEPGGDFDRLWRLPGDNPAADARDFAGREFAACVGKAERVRGALFAEAGDAHFDIEHIFVVRWRAIVTVSMHPWPTQLPAAGLRDIIAHHNAQPLRAEQIVFGLFHEAEEG